VVTLVEVVLAQDVKNTGITLETRRVQCYAIEQVTDATEPRVRGFECYSPDQSVYFVTETKQVIGQVAAVLAGDSRDQCSFGHGGDCSRPTEIHRSGLSKDGKPIPLDLG
jgi:hypothetical protein